jgi:predicted CXXCH cytochrome family protein
MLRRTGPTSERRRRWAGAVTAIAAALPLALMWLALWMGCTVTESNYKTLSFFFDGVPDPSAPVGADGQPLAAGDLRRSPTYVIHKPYEEQNCDVCHQGRLRMSRRDSDVCMKCHEGVRTEHEHMHGPVSAGACLWCHAPHESAYAHLLKDSDRRVCTTCHTPALMTGDRVPAHSDESRACLECHFGHGGTSAFMLRAGAGSERSGGVTEGDRAEPRGVKR